MPDWFGPRPQQLEPFPLAALRELLPLGAVPEQDDIAVTGVTHDSRQVRPGDLYVALPGEVTHGARFLDDAVQAGAAAVLTDDAGASLAGLRREIGGGWLGVVPVIVVDHPRAWLGEVSSAIYAHPSKELLTLGVTGTNGKTTTAYLLAAGLRQAGIRTGLIGTVETRIGDEVVRSVRTTPEATDVHAILAVMRERGMRACVMEVSSHALAYRRASAIRFDVAGFTNLSQDHLDFHADLEEYFATKARLFTSRHAKRAVICVNDEYGRRLAERAEIPSVTVATVVGAGPADWAVERRDDERAEWAAERGTSGAGRGGSEESSATDVVESNASPAAGVLTAADGRSVPLRVPLPGDFNVSNAALAVAMLTEVGVDLEDAADGVAACTGVPGRMERVWPEPDAPDAPMALVDYAHTPDAVQNVLRALRRDRPDGGRLIAVIGAGGDRDRDKRPAMGAAAAATADVVVITDDNPRSEDPAAIRAAVLAGTEDVRDSERADVVEVAGRRDAISAALRLAQGDADTVIVLGKGHEQGQEIAGTVEPFDDREVLREELRGWRAM
ncbi:UDP-N-acetylmuramoyl-L-alanyl-D-glutamate--2,6-diaminopimelate ligase [Phytoactinopolyspora endophytica]|uniref:UDP-N-acetylmuramoyl-L-alanyl-D-glutamate--2, 6-diaminopimelate ligase n=1 Tax=Phytoactinopolyspora endophytica TaxID=1642495 RepID=UPI00101C5D9B|nr:UDP-N-acetylmuramoyl-L-alanyl-D-glutamate--2,6-diaminopimelate ligase [Phytoactinopolyspora endophytica]